MGEFATAVQNYLSTQLGERSPEFEWETEYTVAGTPIDIAGHSNGELILIELEWRRADPADNMAKLFRHLDSGQLDVQEITVFQVFTNYYDLARGDVSSKRKNAEFVGQVAASTFPGLTYHPIGFDFDPPKRGEEWPSGWESIADEMIADLLDAV